ncbi:MAG: hypothetical protein A3E88_02270 [Legionellales bacterium RIFCSPHIGHO2_12_FULL_35_11]|nr:MAG: hypothetical protein A3E88_02270 [Legionellales bacterium RIFCSPHIGHO2_12_FULL_35_11]
MAKNDNELKINQKKDFYLINNAISSSGTEHLKSNILINWLMIIPNGLKNMSYIFFDSAFRFSLTPIGFYFTVLVIALSVAAFILLSIQAMPLTAGIVLTSAMCGTGVIDSLAGGSCQRLNKFFGSCFDGADLGKKDDLDKKNTITKSN